MPASTRQLARFGIADAQALLEAGPHERHSAAVKLHDALAALRKEGRLGALRELDIEEGPFRDLLADPRGIVRSVAIAVAGYTGNRRWVPMLMKYVKEDPDPFARTRAVEALGHLGATETVPLLAEVAEAPSHPARYHAVRALGRMGSVAESDLARLAFEHPEAAVRRVAVETIARTAEPAAWERFLAALSGTVSIAVRKSAVEGLGRSRAARAAVPLVRALVGDPAPEVREAAADALVALGETRTVGALYEAALYDAYAVARPRSGAAFSTEREPESATPKLYPVREAAAEALLVLGGIQAWEELESPQDDLVALPNGLETDGTERV
ncbi:MAG: HEAT repeat domain-containing protein [Vicinamibacterales bacterium]